MPSLAIVDYGMGNIGSVCNALDLLGGRYVVSNRRQDLRSADAIVLPGVGAFGAAMDNLRMLDLVGELGDQVLDRRKPFLGICLGMQLLAKDSVENGFSTGLGWLDAHVLAMEPAGGLRVPHVGWNSLTARRSHRMFARIEGDAHFYFDHGFHLQCDDRYAIASCEYGDRYVAAVQNDHILAVQFHPEKSQRNGLKLLRNCLNFIAEC
ncbi:MAG TPA: imidazole glycerol phosphate synthase subunit HisH [Vicinamibacterales bacterium]|nr:imidazole glycerol phosphate synthase subunit HisH [Vicinamibacterales bacterium]